MVDYLHGSDRSCRTGVGGEGREGSLSARLLDIVVRLASREVRAAAGGERRGLGDDLGAVGERANVVAEHSHLRHRGLEAVDHELLVVCAARPGSAP